MKITGIKTHIIKLNDSLTSILDQYFPTIKENSIIAITSKVVSICEGDIVEKDQVKSKYELIKQEAEAYLPESEAMYGAHLTIKYGQLIASAGIDESNSDNEAYILYPKDPQKSVELVWQHLRDKHQIKNLGVIMTDSHVMPLRVGVIGTCMAWCGFEALFNYIGKPDIFDRKLKITKVNILDALASSAVFVMGEGNEQMPLALIQDAPKIQFVDHVPTQEEKQALKISVEEDLFAPVLLRAPWSFR